MIGRAIVLLSFIGGFGVPSGVLGISLTSINYLISD